MAIKFVDSEPEASDPKKGAALMPAPEPQAEAVQADPPGGQPDGQLPFAKSEPKVRGTKKSLK